MVLIVMQRIKIEWFVWELPNGYFRLGGQRKILGDVSFDTRSEWLEAGNYAIPGRRWMKQRDLP